MIQPITHKMSAEITIPGSKSITNRALLLASLANGESHLHNILLSGDTYAFINALKNLSVEIELDEKNLQCYIKGKGGFSSQEISSIHCQSAGTVARFLLAACAAFKGQYFFDASDQLRKRPIQNLIKILKTQGVVLDAEHFPFNMRVTNKLLGGKIKIPSEETSQFASAMLMISPFAEHEMQIEIQNSESPYIKMTCDMMNEFGVNIQEEKNIYKISNKQTYQARNYFIEPDFSSASYFFAAAALTNRELTIKNLNIKTSKQGDAKFLKILETMGCEVNQVGNDIHIKGTKNLRGVEVDMRYCSDTFMTLAAIAPFANSPTIIKNIAHTRLQESDRIAAVAKILKQLKIKVDESFDSLTIYPGTPIATTIHSHDDHRIAMSFSLIGLRISNLQITNPECVSKTFPEFFSLLQKL